MHESIRSGLSGKKNWLVSSQVYASLGWVSRLGIRYKVSVRATTVAGVGLQLLFFTAIHRFFIAVKTCRLLFFKAEVRKTGIKGNNGWICYFKLRSPYLPILRYIPLTTEDRILNPDSTPAPPPVHHHQSLAFAATAQRCLLGLTFPDFDLRPERNEKNAFVSRSKTRILGLSVFFLYFEIDYKH